MKGKVALHKLVLFITQQILDAEAGNEISRHIYSIKEFTLPTLLVLFLETLSNRLHNFTFHHFQVTSYVFLIVDMVSIFYKVFNSASNI